MMARLKMPILLWLQLYGWLVRAPGNDNPCEVTIDSLFGFKILKQNVIT